MDEVRLALRRLITRPGATIASIVTLACAIGASAVTWSALSAVLLNPLPVRDPKTIFVVGGLVTVGTNAGTVQRGVLYPYYPLVRDSGMFNQVAAAWLPPTSMLVRRDAEPPHDAQVAFVSHEFFPLLGIDLTAGRGITETDDQRGAPPVAILAERYWRRAWNASPDLIGRTVVINGKEVAVIGIAPRGFRGINLSEAPDLFLPLQTIATVGDPRENYFAEPQHVSSPSGRLTIIGRSQQPRSSSSVTAQLGGLSLAGRDTRLAAEEINRQVVPMAARQGMTQFSRLLGATVCLLLLTGCSTVGMLLLIRTEARRGEFAMCMALGASRGRLARGIAFEGMLLAGAGALLSLPIASWLFGLLVSFQLPGAISIERLELGLDGRTLAAVSAAGAAAVVVIALAAGAFGFRADVADALRARSGATPARARRWTRGMLAGAQVAVALFLLAGAGLFARSLSGALNLNAPYDPSRLVLSGLDLAPYGYRPDSARVFFDDLRARLEGNAAVRSVSYSLSLGGTSGKLPIDGAPRPFPNAVSFKAIDDRYFTTLGQRVLSGRDFAATDTTTSPPVGIVSASLGRLLADRGTAIGRRITMPYSRPPAPPPQVEIVGVVPDIVTSVTNLEPLMLYLPLAQQAPTPNRDLAIRATTDSNAARRETGAAIRQLNSAVVMDVALMLTMQERMGRQMGAQRFGAMVLAALGVIAVLLTVLGTYVLAESMAAARMREMGIRAALGATRLQLGAIVLAETTRLVGTGLLVGLGLAWLGANTIRAFLFQVEPLDPVTLGAVAALILTLALVVSLRPALRAARVDLARVLKEE